MDENLDTENIESEIENNEKIEKTKDENISGIDEKNIVDTEEYNDLKKDYNEIKERILRLTAEFDNYKKRSRNEVIRASESGKIEVIKNILPVIDEFELALISIGNSKKNSELDIIIKGVEMIYANLNDALKHLGLETIKTDNGFNPNLHEILMTKESNQKEGSILEVIKKGYTLNGVIIRPVMVIVAGKNEKSENIEDNN